MHFRRANPSRMWGNQRFRYSEDWLNRCEQTSGKTLRKSQNLCGIL